MSRTLWTLGAAALLVGSVAVAFSTTVVGQDFEHQGEITAAGEAYTLAWRDADPGKLRLSLAPIEDAASPSAQLSLFATDRSHLGTYTLDADWPSLDYLVDGRGEYTLVVHQAVDASVEVLTEEGREVALKPAAFATETVPILEGEHTEAAYQLAIERGTRDVHMALAFEGAARGLTIEALNSEGDTILTAAAAAVSTAAGQSLVAELSPDAFTPGSLLVRVSADAFNGTLSLELSGFEEAVRHSFLGIGGNDHHDDEDQEDEAPENEDEEVDDDEAPDKDADARAPAIDGVIVAELESGTPVAFVVPAEAHGVYVIAREDRAHAALFDADDALLELKPIDAEQDGATTWDERERLVAVPFETSGDGEHVIVLRSSYEGYLLFAGIEDAHAGDVRTLEVDEVAVEITEAEGDDTLFVLSRTEATGNAAIEGGLIGFAFEGEFLELSRDVRLIGPGGETVFEAGSSGYDSFHNELCPTYDGGFFVGGAPGEYVVETESEALFTSDEGSFTLLTYIR